MNMAITRLDDLGDNLLDPLILESESEGWRFVRRLADEWKAGTNWFDRPGEALFAAWAGDEIVGVCGVNADPYAGDPLIGRVRRLYVARSHRRCGIGRQLVEAVLHAASGRFTSLRLRTENADASRLYERLGFEATSGIPDCTHVLAIGSSEGPHGTHAGRKALPLLFPHRPWMG